MICERGCLLHHDSPGEAAVCMMYLGNYTEGSLDAAIRAITEREDPEDPEEEAEGKV